MPLEITNQQTLFTTAERRFLFEMSILAVTAGCKLEGFVFSHALEILDNGSPYTQLSKAWAYIIFDQYTDAENILKQAIVEESLHAHYAIALRIIIARLNGNTQTVDQLLKKLEEEKVSPSIMEIAKISL